MIIFKAVAVLLMLVSLATIAAILVDALTGFRYEWLDDLAQIFVAVFAGTVLLSACIGLVVIGCIAVIAILAL